jgi:secondary thiamine-phosphate synthase enzyme
MQETFTIASGTREGLYDITREIRDIAARAQVESGICTVYVRGATAGIMIQENWDDSVQSDVVELLRKCIPRGVWKHDRQDGNGDSHLKAGIVGPSETIPIMSGGLALSRWQNIFLCEFDGPREEREIVVTVLSSL